MRMEENSPSKAQAGTAETQAGNPSGRRRMDIVLVIILGILWGAGYPVIRAALVAGAPPLLLASVRYLFTAAALVPIAILVRTPRPTRADLGPILSFGGLLMIAGNGALLFLGESSISGGLASVLVATLPLVTALIGYQLLPAERFGRMGVIGLLVGFAGVTFLLLPGVHTLASGDLTGSLLVFSGTALFATGSVLLRRTARTSTTFWLLSAQFAVGGLVLGILALLVGEPLNLGNPAVVLPCLAFLVVVCGVLAYSLYFRVLHSSGPTLSNLSGYVIPGTGVLVGLLVFGESVTGSELGGLAMIAFGLFLLQYDNRRLTRTSTGRRPAARRTPDKEPFKDYAQVGGRQG